MQFTNKEIQAAYDEAKEMLSERPEYIDNMNSDFKKLETFLQDHLQEITFDYDINLGTYLKFDRKFYVVQKNEKQTHIPLNECKLTIRLAVYKIMPDFITALGEYVKSNYNLPQ